MSDLENEIVQAKENIKGLIAQLDAAKQLVNEGLASNLQLRTNLNLFNQLHQELVQKNSQLMQDIETIRAQNFALSERVLALSPPPMTEDLQSV